MNASSSSSNSSSSTALSREQLIPLLFQVFAAHGCLPEDTLAQHLHSLTKQTWTSAQLQDLFAFANNSFFRDMGFEIRTILFPDHTSLSSSSANASSSSSASPLIRFHSLLNIEEDHVARDTGSLFTVEELKLFTKVIERLLWRRKMTTADIIEICQENTSGSDRKKVSALQELVRRWEERQWLVRSEASNLLLVGPRTHLELRHLLESYAENPSPEDDDAGRTTATLLQNMPQIIIHG